MLRSALGAFLVMTAASLGFVSYVTKEHAIRASSTAAPPAPAEQVSRRFPVAQNVAPPPTGDETAIAADRLGHFATDIEIDGRIIRARVDTGASFVTLTSEDAMALGLRPSRDDFRMQVATANGVAGEAPVHLRQLRIGNVWIYDVDALVAPPGMLRQSLLGMSALRKLHDFEFSAGRLVLKQ